MAIIKQRVGGKEKMVKKEPSEHAKLCEKAAQWLRTTGRCNLAVHEVVAWCNEKPDAIGWNSSHSTLIEVKRSLSDFRRDAKKYHKRAPEKGMGNYRYYMCPEGVLQPEQMPDDYGLLWILPNGKIKRVLKAELQLSNMYSERTLLTSIARRSIEGCEYMASRTKPREAKEG